jgi:hypothetical protein
MARRPPRIGPPTPYRIPRWGGLADNRVRAALYYADKRRDGSGAVVPPDPGDTFNLDFSDADNSHHIVTVGL